MNIHAPVRTLVRCLAAIGVVLSLLYASAAPSDFTTQYALGLSEVTR